MRVCYLDCASGISGDMVLGALLDAGLDPSRLIEQLQRLNLPGWTLCPATVHRAGLRATLAQVNTEQGHHHRHYGDIVEMIEGSGIPSRARDMALSVFRRLAEAEARVHGVSLEEVHFHEVGAVDSIVDIVGACIGLDLLGVQDVYGSPLPWTRGRVKTEHGILPVPAPATAELMQGWPVEAVDAEGEWVTPTGAAILTALAAGAIMPPMTVETIGYGAGTRDPEGHPNVLRVVLGTMADPVRADTVMKLETNLDDVNPEWLPQAMELVLQAGALDVTLSPVTMKKGRPGFVLSAICPEAELDRVAGIILRHTTSLGVRYHRVARLKLQRETLPVETPWGAVRVKRAFLGDECVNAAPEYEDCRLLSEHTGRPLKEIYTAALAALHRDR